MAAVDDTAEAQAAQARFNARGRVVLILVVVLIGIQALRSALPTDDDVRLLLNFAFVPAGFARLFDPAGIAASATALIRRDAASTGDVILLLGPNGFRWWTLLTYAFLHGSWTHVLVNGYGSRPSGLPWRDASADHGSCFSSRLRQWEERWRIA